MSGDVTLIVDSAAIESLLNSPSGPVAKDLARRAIQVETAAKRLMSQPGRGRTYRRGGVTHRASAPGDPPATDLGRLRAATTSQLAVDERGLHARIGSNYPVQLFLELGTRKMAARPHLRPALEAAR